MFLYPLWLMGLHFKSCVAVVTGDLISESIFNFLQSSKKPKKKYLRRVSPKIDLFFYQFS